MVVNAAGSGDRILGSHSPKRLMDYFDSSPASNPGGVAQSEENGGTSTRSTRYYVAADEEADGDLSSESMIRN